jgi:ATP-dependent RNA helicase RhlE
MQFKELEIIEPILKALINEGYSVPTPIQEKAIPIILDNKDVLGCAQTGTGKTAAFTIPILQHLYGNVNQGRNKQIKALVLTPTRELAVQIGDSFSAYGRYTSLSHTVVYGGVSQRAQTDALRRGVDILIATPGRLLDLMNQGYINLRNVDHFVLDEADRMLDMGFIDDIHRIVDIIPQHRQTLFFSATMPDEIAHFANEILNNPVHIEVTPAASTVDTIEQYLYFADREQKIPLLIDLLQDESKESVLVFSRTKHGADKIAKSLLHAGIETDAIHGNKSQFARQNTLNSFKKRKTRVLIATDIAARGIDINKLSHVINFDLPETPETYVHRIGRTGRAGESGIALSFCDKKEMAFLKNIQKLTGRKIEVVNKNMSELPAYTPVKDDSDRGYTVTHNGRGGSSDRKSGSSDRRREGGSDRRSEGRSGEGRGERRSEGRRDGRSASGESRGYAGRSSEGRSNSGEKRGYAGRSSEGRSNSGEKRGYAGRTSSFEKRGYPRRGEGRSEEGQFNERGGNIKVEQVLMNQKSFNWRELIESDFKGENLKKSVNGNSASERPERRKSGNSGRPARSSRTARPARKTGGSFWSRQRRSA